MDIIEADFSNARVGDRVKCLYRGDGEIQKVSDGDSQPEFKVKVSFDNLTGYIWYSVTGYDGNAKQDSNEINTLFYDFEGQFPTIESCTRPLPKIEKDEKVLIYDDEKERKEYFKEYNQRGGVIVYGDGQTSWSWKGTNIVVPKYWKLESDETINSGNLEEIE